MLLNLCHLYKEGKDAPCLSLITDVVRSQRLRWTGHVARMGKHTVLRQIMPGKPNGTRLPGRPRKRRNDNVKEALESLGVKDASKRWNVVENGWVEKAHESG